VEAHRLAKDDAFRTEPWSPISGAERRQFPGLSYFAPDERWRVNAALTRLKEGRAFEMATSTGEPRLQLRYGRLDLATPEGPASLFAYRDAADAQGMAHAGDGPLFLPFRDLTSGQQTYGAGRYLDLVEVASDTIEVDFNLAYSPYCAYSEAYSCPLPPAENWLKIAVRAGERSFGAP